jgi:hypothetical protein
MVTASAYTPRITTPYQWPRNITIATEESRLKASPGARWATLRISLPAELAIR